MKSLLKALFVCISVVALFPSAYAQLGPPGGGGGGGIDSDPWNPANWDMSYDQELEGELHWIGWDYSPALGQAFPVEGSFSWTTGTGQIGKATNLSGESHTILAEGELRVDQTIKWIGVGPAPETTLVKLTGRAAYTIYGVGGSGSANDGLGHPVIYDGRQWWESEGVRYKQVAINGDGEGLFTIESSANAVITGINVNCEVAVGVPTVELADRAVGMEPFSSPNYRKEYVSPGLAQQKANLTDDPTNLRHDVVALEGIAFPSMEKYWYYQTPLLDAILYGRWDQNSLSIDHSDAVGANPNVAQYARMFSEEELESLIWEGPVIHTMEVDANDNVNQPRHGELMLVIHAPAELPEAVVTEKVFGQWTPVTPEAVVHHGDPITFNTITGIALSHTTSFSIGVNVNASAKFTEAFTAGLSIPATWTWGDSATISWSVGLAQGTTNNSGATRVYWLERRGFYWRQEGFASGYSDNGYIGIVDWGLTYFQSGTGAQASIQDYQQEIKDRPHIP